MYHLAPFYRCVDQWLSFSYRIRWFQDLFTVASINGFPSVIGFAGSRATEKRHACRQTSDSAI
ncbi:hypothetical protein, partial [Paraburkholderia nemoris]|uniref:hypothetical protein n=1 Tax=Paraburkholderia nemoris TaxID=2793076 RepID=UPI001B8C756F